MAIDALRPWVDRVDAELGGRAGRRAVLLLGSALGLAAADVAAVGAVAPELRDALGVDNARIGLLVAASTLTGALATLPVGALADRVRRVPVLAGSIVVWAVAMVAGSLAPGYWALLASRVVLGVVTATTGPTVASLTGDLFPSQDRGRIYGYLLSGELAGAGFGFLVSGTLSSVLSWRAGFWALAPPALILAIAVWRLPEPVRGGEGRLEDGTRILPSGADREADDPVEERVAEAGVEPDPELVLTRDPARMRLWEAVRYVLRVRTSLVLIVASAFGYFYVAGLQTFAVEFLRGQYGLGQAAGNLLLVAIGAGGLAGALVGGRLADRWLEGGRVSARVLVAGGGYTLAAVLFVPGLLSTSLAVAMPFYLAAAAMVAGANPPLDAARLDVLHSGLWGRGEGARTFLRELGVAAAPVAFGALSDALAPGSSDAAVAQGLQYTFLLMLVPLAAAGGILFWGARRYPSDVATAAASGRALH